MKLIGDMLLLVETIDKCRLREKVGKWYNHFVDFEIGLVLAHRDEVSKIDGVTT